MEADEKEQGNGEKVQEERGKIEVDGRREMKRYEMFKGLLMLDDQGTLERGVERVAEKGRRDVL